jgi:hypothetical protein
MYYMPEENIAGPTVLWSDLEDEKVKSKDGKTLGKIRKITQNHFRIEKGSINKKRFWVPKNLGDVFDGKYLWLKGNEEEIHNKFFYGEEPQEETQATSIDRVKVVKERMKGVPTRPENETSKGYKNVRDLE